MRRFLVGTLILAAVSMAFSSCDNAPYDADPKTDNSKVKNPLDPASGVNVYIGTISAVIDGKEVLFTNAEYSTDEHNVRHITAIMHNDPMFSRDIHLFFHEDSYKGPVDYNIGASDLPWTFYLNKRDTTVIGRSRNLDKTYSASPTCVKGGLLFKLVGHEDGNLRGTFQGVIYKLRLDQDFKLTTDVDETDSMIIEKAEFYIPKKKQ